MARGGEGDEVGMRWGGGGGEGFWGGGEVKEEEREREMRRWGCGDEGRGG